MILGIGTDLANIDRIAATLDRFGDRFRNRVFTPTEQAKAERRKDVAGTYAKRWAAKEACSKALGTGLRMGRRTPRRDDPAGARGHHPRHPDRRSPLGAGLRGDRGATDRRESPLSRQNRGVAAAHCARLGLTRAPPPIM